MSKASESDTERIVRAVDQIQARQTRPPSGQQHTVDTCPQAEKIRAMESKLEQHEARFNDGEKQFIRLESGLANVAEKVGTLNSVIAWVGGIVGVGLLGTAGTALVWVLGQMGKP